MLEDLAKSGLIPSDIDARVIMSPERAMCIVPHTTDGYVIPYYHIDGKPLPHYRVRLFSFDPKYKQPKETSNYVYFPKGFFALSKGKPYILITEGEKKAALAVKKGFPTVALGGVDNWRNRQLIVPASTEFTQSQQKVNAKLPAGSEISEDLASSLAIGVQELIDYAAHNNKHLIFAYDTDGNHVKYQVQRAAATFAFDLRFRGIAFNHIRQIILPSLPSSSKIGLDDLLMHDGGHNQLTVLIANCLKQRSAFPQHPSVRDFLNKRLQKSKLSRKETQAVAIAVLSDLDSNGLRLRSDQELQTYYFDHRDNRLLKAEFDRISGDFHDTKFGQFLYRRYGLSSSDSRLIEWLAAQFTGEDPVGVVSPHRVLARTNTREDAVIYQMSDSHYAHVDAKGLTIHPNGAGGILFESEQVEPLDTDKLKQEFDRQRVNNPTTVKPYWMETLSSVRLKDHDKHKQITALLYYMSPWLYRWRGTQLPVEMIIGESGSGKSTLYELRLSIITGIPRLRNAPQDLKDWHASIVNTGGLHVTDNVQLVDRNLRQRLSDEICRIITEPTPSIEMRKYYTNADLVRIPVRSVFAITAIQQPFQNADLIQRSIITELDKMGNIDTNNPIEIRYDSEWRNDQLTKYNGREGWVAHHLLVLHRFFQLVQQKWSRDYQAHHRLINFEQAMVLMAEVVGLPSDWIPGYLVGTTDRALSESDWTFEGLKSYTDYHRHYLNGNPIYTQQISDWATQQEDYQKCEILINARRLGRYMTQHKTMIATIIGIVENGTKNNRTSFKLVGHKK